MATACEVRDPDTEGSGEQDPAPRGDPPSSPEGRPGKPRGRRRRRRKARLTGLSQQRQAANARERYRTKSVQDALQQLSCCIPTPVPTPTTRLSKIEILRLASQYIEHLTNVLNENDPTGTGASKARPEDDKGTGKTKGSARGRGSRSRQGRDDETVVYLTRRRIKDMQPCDKEPTEAVESNLGQFQVQDQESCQQVNSQALHDSNDGRVAAILKKTTAQTVGNKATSSDTQSAHYTQKKHVKTSGSGQTGNGNSGPPHKVCESDMRLPEVETERHGRDTCTQVLSTKYAVREHQRATFHNVTGNADSVDKLYRPPYMLLNGNGPNRRPDCRFSTVNGFGVSHARNGQCCFTGYQIPDYATGSRASGFSDHSGFQNAMMSGQYGLNSSFESDDSNLSISR